MTQRCGISWGAGREGGGQLPIYSFKEVDHPITAVCGKRDAKREIKTCVSGKRQRAEETT